MTFEELVSTVEQQMIQQNYLDLRQNYKNKEYQEKISKFANKYSLDKKEIEKQILENDIVAAMFIKDPKKQNFTEKLVSDVLNISSLPPVGKNCIRFLPNGNITNQKTPDSTKSADFYFQGMYITQKYTRETGGAQDNQYNDVVDFLTKGSKKYKVGCIVDGNYWLSKAKELKIFFQNNCNVKIMSMEEFMNDYKTK